MGMTCKIFLNPSSMKSGKWSMQIRGVIKIYVLLVLLICFYLGGG